MFCRCFVGVLGGDGMGWEEGMGMIGCAYWGGYGSAGEKRQHVVYVRVRVACLCEDFSECD